MYLYRQGAGKVFGNFLRRAKVSGNDNMRRVNGKNLYTEQRSEGERALLLPLCVQDYSSSQTTFVSSNFLKQAEAG